MRRSVTAALAASVFAAAAGSAILWSAQARARVEPQQATAQSSPASTPAYRNEQAWIVADVENAIVDMAQYRGARSGERPTFRIDVQDHIWSPGTFSTMAGVLLAGGEQSAADADFDARSRLTTLTVDVLLDENERLSAALGRDMRSPAAHESAALLVAAHALREPASMFADVRSALSRIAAHLAVARALRQGAVQGLDGALAHAVLTVLVGRQREALVHVEAIERRASTAADRAWVRGLRLRITGDWRTPFKADDASLLERLEYARALRARAGPDRLLDFLDTFEPEDLTDWHRIALADGFNIETGARFTERVVERELAEAQQVWSRLHGRRATREDLLAALNDTTEKGPVVRVSGMEQVRILGWGSWAAFEQRQLSHALTGRSRHLYNLGAPDDQAALVADVKAEFSRLALYPIVLRWLALTRADYEDSMAGARRLASATPQLITVASWNLLVEKPRFVQQASRFPFVETWFEPAVPQGTAFDLYARALLPGCPRPPTVQQAKQWAAEALYDHWVLWSAEWYAVTGKPGLASVRRSFGALLDYDYGASLKLIDYMEMSAADRIDVARQLCRITTTRCHVLAELLLREGRAADAVATYEGWIAGARDSVRVSNQLTWLVRHYHRTGHTARAEEVARIAASAGSSTGLETYAHLLDAQRRYDEAERFYQRIAERYDETGPLGTFTIRQALRKDDRAMELKGWDLLRSEFPNGLQRVDLHALDVPPRDGIVFNTFGPRAAAVGLRQTDIVVGVDDWRVRNNRQYGVISRLRHDEEMIFVVWRGDRYQVVRARVPERWLGLRLDDYAGRRAGN
jgi:hypothetical protein